MAARSKWMLSTSTQSRPSARNAGIMRSVNAFSGGKMPFDTVAPISDVTRERCASICLRMSPVSMRPMSGWW